MADLDLEDGGSAAKWQLLLVYNFYRLGCVLLFFVIFGYELLGINHRELDFLALNSLYLLICSLFFYLRYRKQPSFESQVIVSGTSDIIIQALLISFLGSTRSWLSILLNATIAALGILAPGRLAIFFAAIASCMLLGFSVFQYSKSDASNLSTFFYTGVHGAGFFATAITAWYLANRVRASETLAAHRSHELAGMQRINEYIVERMHSGVIYMDPDRQIKLINDAALKFFNCPEEGLHSLAQLSQALDKKYNYYLEKIIEDQRVGKTTIDDPYLQVHFFPTPVADRVAVLVLLDDMTSVSQQAQQLKLAALGRFSASIAHELRNPLGSIAHAAQLMGENDLLPPDDLRLKELILNNCNRMNRIIKNVMQLSRREQSQQQAIDLKEFLAQFKRDFCLHNPCDIRIQLTDEAMNPFYFDKSQLDQILVILCDNAIHHGKDEFGRVFITIQAVQEGQSTRLMICDTGKGVDDALREAIFEPFFSTQQNGYGMGLFIARDLCEINQARLAVLKVNKGSCFTITSNQASEMQL